MSPDERLILAALADNDWATVPDIAKAAHRTMAHTRLVLYSMRKRNWVERGELNRYGGHPWRIGWLGLIELRKAEKTQPKRKPIQRAKTLGGVRAREVRDKAAADVARWIERDCPLA